MFLCKTYLLVVNTILLLLLQRYEKNIVQNKKYIFEFEYKFMVGEIFSLTC